MRAINNRWPIPEERKAEIVDQILDLITDPEVSPKTRVQAFSAILKAEGQNQADQRLQDPLQAKIALILEGASGVGTGSILRAAKAAGVLDNGSRSLESSEILPGASPKLDQPPSGPKRSEESDP